MNFEQIKADLITLYNLHGLPDEAVELLEKILKEVEELEAENAVFGE